jgi:hypothetical protein
VRGYGLTWNSKRNSSKRTIAAANAMASVEDPQKHSNPKKIFRWNEKHKNIASLNEIITNTDKSYSSSDAEGKEFGPSPSDIGLDIYTSDQGRVHWVERAGCIFSVIVIPREDTLDAINPTNTASVIDSLNKLQKSEKSCERSKGKTGISESNASYAIMGNKVHRGRHGFIRDKLSDSNIRSSNNLKKWARRLEHVVAKYIPSYWLAAIKNANALKAWPTFGQSKFVAAMASSVNYSAPAHVDDDFLFSIHQVNVDGCLTEDDTEIVQCFCFPTYGFAIGLRPGDIILFNPHIHHCLSKKSEAYANKDVHVTTFYIKTAHVGKNDNSLPLTEEEENLYNMTF